ncbi:6-pyruvoyl trahydropterin synthase family protein [Succinimonas amylolytica]|uniref:6-pyruvoyl trahydropterin synthase family protein n=1 Tax=Succinimonas amylolytica TaxID=83769 RepID=UPI00037C1E28|nr:6-carboxytetrahydropterin synthase [Succinimonas amylolytica]
MFKIKKRIIISAAHFLKLDYTSKCTGMHGHNWVIDVYLKSPALDRNGMVMDFSEIKSKVKSVLDHKVLNEVISVNPTAENIALWVCETLGEKCYRVDVQESPDNIAIYERD